MWIATGPENWDQTARKSVLAPNEGAGPSTLNNGLTPGIFVVTVVPNKATNKMEVKTYQQGIEGDGLLLPPIASMIEHVNAIQQGLQYARGIALAPIIIMLFLSQTFFH